MLKWGVILSLLGLYIFSMPKIVYSQSWECYTLNSPSDTGTQVLDAGICNDLLQYIPGYLTPVSQSKQLNVNVTAFVMCHNGDTMRDPFTNQVLDFNRIK